MFDLNAEVLCSGLFSDVMDRMGYKKQIITGMKRNRPQISFLGRARTIEIIAENTDDENIRMGLSFLGTVGKDEILIVNGSDKFAYFGELMTKLSSRNHIEGVIINGLTRDTNYTHREDVMLPVLAKGYSPVDIKGRGRVEAVDVEIEIDGVTICPGDLVYADNEAVCIVPNEIETEVAEKIREKLEDEIKITELIESGISVEELLEKVTEF